MNPISAIALSGMSAASTRLAVSAQNVANASTASARSIVDQVEIAGGGTAAQISSPASSYGPPSFGAGGADVDLAAEAVDQLSASLAFAANLAVLRMSNQMTKSLLDVMA